MSRREDTCHGKKCPFWTRYGENCPHYMDIPWEADDGGKYYTKDCAPKRGLLLQLETYNLTLGTRRDTNKTRNVTEKFIQAIVCHSGGVIEGEVVDQQQIEETTDGKDTDQ
jgi:hypothetical protein